MGYHPETVNFYGFTLNDDENDAATIDEDTDPFAEDQPYAFLSIGAFDGADSRIDEFEYAIVFRKYSWSSNGYDKISGDTNGTPTVDEIAELKAFCIENNLPVKEPKRIVRSYII